jgi:hypothetical protein
MIDWFEKLQEYNTSKKTKFKKVSELLQSLYEDHGSYAEIGRILGVSNRSVALKMTKLKILPTGRLAVSHITKLTADEMEDVLECGIAYSIDKHNISFNRVKRLKGGDIRRFDFVSSKEYEKFKHFNNLKEE